MTLLPFAILFITLALVFYTVGVWAEKIKGRLRMWHSVVFWCGFAFDTLGTTLMGQMAGSSETTGINFHAITGAIAIALMLLHAIWATIALRRNNEKTMVQFHKFSVVVWIIWLVPFISGMAIGMMR